MRLPIIDTVLGYSRRLLRDDLSAGVLVAILLVPQAIAYAYLAGMPPEYGLYTALIPCLLYALLGTSPHLSIGPVAVSALLVHAGVSQLAAPFSSEYVVYVVFLGFCVGVVQAALGFASMGKMINLLSYPVITGFTSAAAVIVIVNQLKDIFALEIPKTDYLYQKLQYILSHVVSIHVRTLCLGLIVFVCIGMMKKISKRIPYGLIVVALTIIISYSFDFESMGIAVIGDVPSGLASFSVPRFSYDLFLDLIPTILIVSFIGIIEAVGIAKAIASKHDWYQVDTNQELKALGISKIGGSFFQAIPSSGSFSRSALLNESGAKTTVASIITVVFVIGALLFLTPTLYYLPKVVLAVIIVYAVSGLFEYAFAKRLWQTNKRDLLTMLITFVLTVIFGVEVGIGGGFLVSLITVMSCSETPFASLRDVLFLRNRAGVTYRRNADRDIITLDKPLNFSNCEHFKMVANQTINNNSDLLHLHLEFLEMDDIDCMGLKSLSQVCLACDARDVVLTISDTNDKVAKRLQHLDLPTSAGDETSMTN